jgi:hypothetical protein
LHRTLAVLFVAVRFHSNDGINDRHGFFTGVCRETVSNKPSLDRFANRQYPSQSQRIEPRSGTSESAGPQSLIKASLEAPNPKPSGCWPSKG